MDSSAKDAVDAAAIISSSTETIRLVVAALADADHITPDLARSFRNVTANIDDAAILLASRVATPEMFADRT